MDIERAKELLTVLADGINPVTGEVLSDNDSCNQVEIVRALHTAILTMENAAAKRTRPQPENAGKPWTEEEESQLISEYRSGIKGSEIAKLHNRSKGAIAARLAHLGEISDRYEFK